MTLTNALTLGFLPSSGELEAWYHLSKMDSLELVVRLGFEFDCLQLVVRLGFESDWVF
jgi:hypothetical protein